MPTAAPPALDADCAETLRLLEVEIARLAAAAAQKAAVLDSAREAIVTVDGEGAIVEFNAAAERLLGRRRETVLGRRAGDLLVPPRLRQRFCRAVTGLADLAGLVVGRPFEGVALHAAGGELPIEITIFPVDLAGPPLFTASLRDVSERQRAEEALRESENRAQAIIDHMLGGLIMADDGYVIESVNAAAARMFGYEREELIGKDLWKILPEFGEEDDDLQLRFVEPEVQGSVSEWWGQRKDGSIFPFELSLCAFWSGGQRYIAGNLRDLTELHEVDRLKQELVSTVNHELRTPITSIRGSLTLLASGALGEIPAEAGEMIALAERNCLRLITLINEILDLECLDRGQAEMSREPVPVATLMERSREVVRGMADDKGVAIDLHPIPGRVLGDFDRLVQVMVNLLGNAIKFSPADSAVTVSAVAVQETIEIRVRDHGRGIAAAHRDLIFERFKQIETSDSRQKGGTGLGLAICKSIVKQLGGQIGVDSEEAAGSVFWFRLAAEPEGGAAAAGPHPALKEERA